MIDAFRTTTRRSLFSLGAALGLASATEAAKKKKGKKKRCKRGLKRCGKKCVNLQTSKDNCGRCGNRCQGERTCENGQCVCRKQVCLLFRRETDFFPSDLAYDPASLQVIATEEDRLLFFSNHGIFQSQFGEFGQDPGEFNGPADVATPGLGLIYVADDGNDRIQRIDAANEVTVWPFDDSPVAVAVTSNLTVYTALDGQVHRLGGDGEVLYSWGPGGEPNAFFDDIWDLAIDDDGRVYALEEFGNRAYRFTDGGQGAVSEDWAVGAPGVDPGEFRFPEAIAVADGRVFVADTDNHRVQALNADDGSPLFQWQAEDSFGLWDPEGVAVGENGWIYVSSFDTILIFELGEP